MYRIILTSRGTENKVLIERESREEFSNTLKSFVGPNSGWYSEMNPLPMYINKFWDSFIDTCKC